MPALHARVSAALDAAGDLTGAALLDHIRVAHASDPELVAEIERLFSADVPGVLDHSLGAAARLVAETALADAGSPATPVPARVGAFVIHREIGRGGMGVVYEAEQDEPRRRVALKVIRSLTPAAASRLRREAATMARLKHPGVAQIYHAGVDPVAGPYIAMEFVDGPPLLEFAARHRLSLHQRLDLLASICDAVHAAHQNAIIHRDIKPSNVLVELLPDGSPCPKVLDFGVASITDAEHAHGVTASLDHARIVGTLGYMSPEAIEPPPEGIDTRADVYALGVLLYELVAGRPPIEVQGLGLTEAARRVLAQAPEPLERSVPAARGDLSLIAATAVAKDRERRYSSAAALASDLRRFIACQPIAARPPTLLYQVRKLAQRNRALAIAGVLGVLALAGAAIVATLSAVSEHRALEVTREALDLSERRAYAASIAAAARAVAQGAAPAAGAALDQAPVHLRGWEWDHLRARADAAVSVAPSVTGSAFTVGAAPDDSLYVVYADRLAIVDPATWRELQSTPIDPPPRSFAVSTDGRLIAHLNSAGRLRVLSSDLAEAWALDGVRRLDRAAFSANAELVVQTDLGFRTALLDGRTGANHASFDAASPPGQGAFFGADPDVWYEVGFGSHLLARRRHDAHVLWKSKAAGAWRAAPGTNFIAALVGPEATLIDPRSGDRTWRFVTGEAPIATIAADPLTGLVALSDELGAISLFSANTGRALHTLLGHTRASESVFLDDRRLASGTGAGSIRLWNPFASPVRTITPPPERISTSRLALAAQRVIAIGWGSVLGWDTVTGAPTFARYIGRTAGTPLIALEPDGSSALLLGWRRGGLLVRTADAAILREFPELPTTCSLAAWTPRGIILVHQDGASLLDPESGTLAPLDLPPTTAITRTPTGALLGGADGVVRRWNPDTGVSELDHPHQHPVSSMDVSADGLIVSADIRGNVFIRRPDSVVAATVPGRVTAVTLARGAKRAALCTPGSVHLLDTDRGDLVFSLAGPAQAFDAAFSPDAASLAIAGGVPLTLFSRTGHHDRDAWEVVQDAAAYVSDIYRNQPRSLASDVRQQVIESPLAPEVRAAALHAVQVWSDPVPLINSNCWSVAISAGAPLEEALRAVRAMEHLCDTHPDASLLNTLAFCYFRARRFEDAATAFRRSSTLAGSATDVLTSNTVGLAMSLHQLGRFDEAARLLEQSLAANPSDADTRAFLHEARQLMGSPAPAEGHN